MRRLFGTDGVRGVANVYPMTTAAAASPFWSKTKNTATASSSARTPAFPAT